jgi:double-stranded uracil-DNA glycosylase
MPSLLPDIAHARVAVLDDILRDGLKLAFCGTAASTVSADVGHYYAGPGNKFWRTLAELGLTPRQLAPYEAGLLLQFGIGLTDLIKGQAGADGDIQFDKTGAEALRRKILTFQPTVLCFNGKRAAKEFFDSRTVQYGLQPERFGLTRVFVAPSTSAAANGAGDASRWRELADLVRSS